MSLNSKFTDKELLFYITEMTELCETRDGQRFPAVRKIMF
jgi:hypothetical protein